MFNLILDGRVGKNGAEVKTSKGGKQYLKFSLANNSYSGGQNKTTWFDVICYKPEIINGIGQYLKKGSFVYVHTNVIEDVTHNVDQNQKVWINRIITADWIEFPQTGKRDDDNSSSEVSTYTATTKQHVNEFTTNMPQAQVSTQMSEEQVKAYAEQVTTQAEDWDSYSGDSDDLPF